MGQKLLGRIFNFGEIQYVSLTADEVMNRSIYRNTFYVITCRSYKCLKTVRLSGPTGMLGKLLACFNHMPVSNKSPRRQMEASVLTS